MEHGRSDLSEIHIECQQQIGKLKQTVSHQQGVITQQAEMIVAFQEQLARAAEQLRLLKRAMFGQRRERYAPSPDQTSLFTPEALAEAEVPPQEEKPADEVPAATTKKRRARRPRIEFPQYLEHRRTEYVLNRWAAFVRYTEDGRIPIDNNVIERLLRPVAIGRKNYLHFGSEEGGKTGATLYTLVQSARRNCVDVWPYLTDVLRRIAAIAPGDTAALEALLPDRWLNAHPEHRLGAAGKKIP